MKPSRHFLCSAVFSAGLAPWLKWRALLVFAGGVILDLDRYIGHVVRYRTFRIQPAIERFQGRDRIRGDIRFLHSVEFFAVIAIGAVFFPWVRILSLGVALHILLDLLIHKSRGRFWLYFDPSHLHCLSLDLLDRIAARKWQRALDKLAEELDK